MFSKLKGFKEATSEELGRLADEFWEMRINELSPLYDALHEDQIESITAIYRVLLDMCFYKGKLEKSGAYKPYPPIMSPESQLTLLEVAKKYSHYKKVLEYSKEEPLVLHIAGDMTYEQLSTVLDSYAMESSDVESEINHVVPNYKELKGLENLLQQYLRDCSNRFINLERRNKK